MSYKLLSYSSQQGEARAGLLVGDLVHDAARVCGDDRYASVLGILQHWEEAQSAISAGLENARNGVAITDEALLAPVLYPGQIYAAGANYQDHIDEMVKRGMAPAGPNAKQAGGRPWHFVKTGPSAVVGHRARRPMPSFSAKVDWEIELAVVIGKTAKNVTIESAMEYVAGYTIANDLSARDAVIREEAPPSSPFRHDWIGSKNFDGACPMGPWIVPASQMDDPMNLQMKLWVDDEIMQDSSTRHMIFSIAEQIVELSSRITLNPGDVILTGTPDGVGMGRNVFLKPGQELRLWIEGIGELRHSLEC